MRERKRKVGFFRGKQSAIKWRGRGRLVTRKERESLWDRVMEPLRKKGMYLSCKVTYADGRNGRFWKDKWMGISLYPSSFLPYSL